MLFNRAFLLGILLCTLTKQHGRVGIGVVCACVHMCACACACVCRSEVNDAFLGTQPGPMDSTWFGGPQNTRRYGQKVPCTAYTHTLHILHGICAACPLSACLRLRVCVSACLRVLGRSRMQSQADGGGHGEQDSRDGVSGRLWVVCVDGLHGIAAWH